MNRFIRKIARLFRYGEPGFTLIELLIVIAVLGALAGVVAPNVSNMMGGANIAAANSEVQAIKTASNSHLADYGIFPVTSWDLFAVTGENATATAYLSAAPKEKYTFNAQTGLIDDVTTKASGWWTGVIFDLSDQKWIRNTGTISASSSHDQT